jgi:hypothetical protein
LKDRGKRFEGSLIRVLIIMIITYGTIYGYLIYLGVPRPGNPYNNFVIPTIIQNHTANARLITLIFHASELNAIVPTIGFNLSTWSLPWIKLIWLRIYDYYLPISDTNV